MSLFHENRLPSLIPIFVAAFFYAANLDLWAETRTWTRTDGKTVEAELAKVTAVNATLKLAGGRLHDIRISQLSAADQQYIADWFAKQKKMAKGDGTTSKPEAAANAALGYVPVKPRPLPIPDQREMPQAGTKLCRLVVVETPDANRDLDKGAYTKIQEDDFTDLVKLGERMADRNVAAIREGGLPLLWQNDGTVLRERGAKGAVAVFSEKAEAMPLVWLTEGGKVDLIAGNGDLKKSVKRLQKVSCLNTMQNTIFTIDGKGKRKVQGGWMVSDKMVQFFEESGQDIAGLIPGAPWGFRVLRTNGRIDVLAEGLKLRRGDEEGVLAEILTSNFGFRPDGTCFPYRGYGWMTEPLKQIGHVHRITHGGGLVAVQQKVDGPWMIWNERKGNQRDPELEAVFGDAGDLQFQYDRAWYALLPAESVPRSGLYKMDEIIAVRKNATSSGK